MGESDITHQSEDHETARTRLPSILFVIWIIVFPYWSVSVLFLKLRPLMALGDSMSIVVKYTHVIITFLAFVIWFITKRRYHWIAMVIGIAFSLLAILCIISYADHRVQRIVSCLNRSVRG